MRDDIQNPRLIAKNGFLLFARLLLVMAIAFYATRLTLQILGDEDYGINNIIGGVISIFAIVSNPITGVLQRFFNVEFTKQEIPGNVVFFTSLRIVLVLSLVMIFLYESIGLYVVNGVLNYPQERTITVNIVFQLTVLSSLCSLISLPYLSLLYSKEDMGIPATIEVISSLLKLGLLVSIPFIPLDYLITYACIVLSISFLQLLFYYFYCKHRYDETRYTNTNDINLRKEIIGFAGWSFLNAASGISITYISNLFINIFGGVLYNTAYAISTQLSNAVLSFSTNVMKAVDPQITSSTTASQDSYRNAITLSTIKLCLIGVGFCYIIFHFYGFYLLELWLGRVPDYVLPFCQIALLNIMFSSVILPLRAIILATGKIQRYFVGYAILSFFALTLMYFLLRMGNPVIIVMYFILGVNIGMFINAIVIVNTISSLSIKKVILVLSKSLLVLISTFLIAFLLRGYFQSTLLHFIMYTCLLFAVIAILFFFIGVDDIEKKAILSFVKTISNNFRKH